MKADTSTIAARMRALGYPQGAKYADYLASDHWQGVRRHYAESGRPQDCACGAPATALHHKTYERLGCEKLSDLEPGVRRLPPQAARQAEATSAQGEEAEVHGALRPAGPAFAGLALHVRQGRGMTRQGRPELCPESPLIVAALAMLGQQEPHGSVAASAAKWAAAKEAEAA